MSRSLTATLPRIHTAWVLIGSDVYEVTFTYSPEIPATWYEPPEPEEFEIEEIYRVWKEERVPFSSAIFEAAERTGVFDSIYDWWVDKCRTHIHRKEE